MSEGNMVYLGLCVRYEPPIIGVHYKNKQTDEKKKVYTIVLQRLIFNPNPMEVTEQLYMEHPHILKENKIPKDKIAILVQKIQKQLRIGEEYDDDEEQDEHEEHEEDYDEDYQHDEEDNAENHEQDDEEQQQQPKKQPEQPEVPQKKRPKFDFDKDFGRDDGPLNRSM